MCPIPEEADAMPLHHDRKFLTAFQDKRHLVSNWSPYLSPHLKNSKLDRPDQTLRLAEEIFEPTVLPEPTPRPEYLKQSAASRRSEISFPDYNYTNGNDVEEDIPRQY